MIAVVLVLCVALIIYGVIYVERNWDKPAETYKPQTIIKDRYEEHEKEKQRILSEMPDVINREVSYDISMIEHEKKTNEWIKEVEDGIRMRMNGGYFYITTLYTVDITDLFINHFKNLGYTIEEGHQSDMYGDRSVLIIAWHPRDRIAEHFKTN